MITIVFSVSGGKSIVWGHPENLSCCEVEGLQAEKWEQKKKLWWVMRKWSLPVGTRWYVQIWRYNRNHQNAFWYYDALLDFFLQHPVWLAICHLFLIVFTFHFSFNPPIFTLFFPSYTCFFPYAFPPRGVYNFYSSKSNWKVFFFFISCFDFQIIIHFLFY